MLFHQISVPGSLIGSTAWKISAQTLHIVNKSKKDHGKWVKKLHRQYAKRLNENSLFHIHNKRKRRLFFLLKCIKAAFRFVLEK